jgi:GntR family transcriptional regulator, histidine utilization repressor
MTTETASRTNTDFPLDGRGPLYRQIKRAIAGTIHAGVNEPGDRLPSEHEFVEIFGTSRMTVNRALQMLADENLIVRHRRNGTFVAKQVAEHAVMELRDIADEIEETGAVYSYEILECSEVFLSKAVAERLEASPGDVALFVRCRHLSDGEPVVIEDRHISLVAVPAAATADFDKTPPNRWLLRHVPWSRVEHVILAINANKSQARLLNMSAGDACLRVERKTWMADHCLTSVQLTYPGDRHRLIGRFSTGQ